MSIVHMADLRELDSNILEMDALFIGDDDSDKWELISSNGCCRFRWHRLAGRGVVEISGGCHACIDEVKAYALERGYDFVRLPPGLKSAAR